MRIHQPRDPDQAAALTRLAGQVDRLEHQLTDLVVLRADVDAHTRTLSALTDLIRRVTTSNHDDTIPEDLDSEAVADWLTLTDPATAVTCLNRLHRWVTDVWTHYTPIPACWPWHPTVVAELLACQQLWAAALVDGAPAEVIAAWHDRWRPGAAGRVKQTLGGCLRAEPLHVIGATHYCVDLAYLDEVATWWTTSHGHTSPPGLTRTEPPR